MLNLGTPDDPKYIKISKTLSVDLTIQAETILKAYTDVFARSYTVLKGIPEHIATHCIILDVNISLSRESPYRMNPNYANAVKEDLEGLLHARFITPVDEATWLSPIVVVPKKTGELRICMDFRWLNGATYEDPYPLPFTNMVLDYHMCSFMDGFANYHNIKIQRVDQ